MISEDLGTDPASPARDRRGRRGARTWRRSAATRRSRRRAKTPPRRATTVTGRSARAPSRRGRISSPWPSCRDPQSLNTPAAAELCAQLVRHHRLFRRTAHRRSDVLHGPLQADGRGLKTRKAAVPHFFTPPAAWPTRTVRAAHSLWPAAPTGAMSSAVTSPR